MKIQLVDRSEKMIEAWTKEFSGCDDVSIHLDDFFSVEAQCIVSPANSFGFMGGGLDGVISRRLGKQTQINVQKYIKNTLIGELLVGQAIMVETGDKDFPFCLSAPTMRVSLNINNTPNIYLASKAIFATLLTYPLLKSVNISGLGTGVGGVSPEHCAEQMRLAYDEVWLRKMTHPQSLTQSIIKHNIICNGSPNEK